MADFESRFTGVANRAADKNHVKRGNAKQRLTLLWVWGGLFFGDVQVALSEGKGRTEFTLTVQVPPLTPQ